MADVPLALFSAENDDLVAPKDYEQLLQDLAPSGKITFSKAYAKFSHLTWMQVARTTCSLLPPAPASPTPLSLTSNTLCHLVFPRRVGVQSAWDSWHPDFMNVIAAATTR